MSFWDNVLANAIGGAAGGLAVAFVLGALAYLGTILSHAIKRRPKPESKVKFSQGETQARIDVYRPPQSVMVALIVMASTWVGMFAFGFLVFQLVTTFPQWPWGRPLNGSVVVLVGGIALCGLASLCGAWSFGIIIPDSAVRKKGISFARFVVMVVAGFVFLYGATVCLYFDLFGSMSALDRRAGEQIKQLEKKYPTQFPAPVGN